MEAMNFSSAEQEASILELYQPDASVLPASQAEDHAYMGYPLQRWVGGFQSLYPEPPSKNKE
jgi:hypothetical protein